MRRPLADRHLLPFSWTLSLHRRRCPSASHRPVFCNPLELSVGCVGGGGGELLPHRSSAVCALHREGGDADSTRVSPPNARVHSTRTHRDVAHRLAGMYNAPPNGRRNPNKSVEQIGGPIFQQNRFPVPWISVPGPKYIIHLPFGCSVVGVMWKAKICLNFQKKIFISLYMVLKQ